MNRWIIFTVCLGCGLYAEPGSGQLLQALLMPGAALAGTVYLMGWQPSLILGAAASCFYYTDLFSDSLLNSVMLPLFGLFWIVMLLHWAYKSGHLRGAGGAHGGDGCDGGFDAGGGCDGGGGGE